MGMHRRRGFTLIELMVAVAVIGVLAAIAYPSYLGQVRKANRSAAQQFMLDVATREQQLMLDNRGYVAVTATANFPNAPSAGSPGINLTVPPAASAKYNFVAGVNNGASPPTFTITGTPIAGSSQASDGALTLDQSGVKLPANKW
jgi:type IV pilus assembly protein PilE